MDLVAGWGQVLKDEQAKVSALQVEREAREEGRDPSPLGSSLSLEFAWKNCFREENLSRGASETFP